MRRDQTIWPLDAPGMSPLGPAYIEAALLRDGPQEPEAEPEEELAGGKKKKKAKIPAGPVASPDTLARLVRASLYGEGLLRIDLPVPGGRKSSVPVISGHLWGRGLSAPGRNGDKPTFGPERSDVMVVGKMLGEEEVLRRRHLAGPTGLFLIETLRKLGLPDGEFGSWYVTNALLCPHPDRGAGWRAGWVKEFHHLQDQELRLVQPKFILCLGADALKSVMRDSKMTVTKAEGRVLELSYCTHRFAGDPQGEHKTALVMVAKHPVEVLHQPEYTERFELSLSRFLQLVQGQRWDLAEEDLDHRIVRTERELLALVEEARRDNPSRIVAVDAEWQGEHPQNPGAYLRCVQFSWADKKAACVALRNCRGEEDFDAGVPRAIEILRKYFQDQRVVGHMFSNDLQWLLYEGLDLSDQYAAAERWEDCKEQGGWDTGLMAHAVDETSDFTLNALMLRYVGMPRYDMALDEWRAKSPENTHGAAPDELLYPYAVKDPDATRRLAMALVPRLDSDRFGNNCWKPFWTAHRASRGVLEINTTGLPVDRERADSLMRTYYVKKEELGRSLREWARWPELNLESHYQVRELLFGARFNNYQKLPDGSPFRSRPPGARSLHLIPVLTTDKPPKPWEEVLEEKAEGDYTPTTDKNATSILWHASADIDCRRWDASGEERIVKANFEQPIEWFRHYRTISQVCKNVLRPPDLDESIGQWVEDEDGNLCYSKGLLSCVCGDGRIRTTINQLKETGRWASSRPPLQNIAKNKENDYAKILGDDYTHPIRTVFRAPSGWVFIESDYVSAELFVEAFLSQDPKLMEHLQRSLLPKSHPDHLNVHCNVAVQAYGLDCPPTKKGLEKAGKIHLYEPAKALVYGIGYGRQDKAISVQLRSEGIKVSVDEVRLFREAFLGTYDQLEPFFQECCHRAADQDLREERRTIEAPGWVVNAFGRYRRFAKSNNPAVRGDMERQAMNFVIQGTVADAVNTAVYHLHRERENLGLRTRIALQIHDAVLLLSPVEEVDLVIKELLPRCMSELVPIYPCRPGGEPIEAGPYRLEIESDVCLHWGEKITKDQCRQLGLAEEYGK